MDSLNIGNLHWSQIGKSYHGIISVGELYQYAQNDNCSGYSNVPGSSLAFISGHCYIVKEGDEFVLITHRKEIAFEQAFRLSGRWQEMTMTKHFEEYPDKVDKAFENKMPEELKVDKAFENELPDPLKTEIHESGSDTEELKKTDEPQRSIPRKKYSVYGTVSTSPPAWLTSNSIWLERAWMRLEDGSTELLDNPIVMFPQQVKLPERGMPVEITGEAGFESSVQTFVFFSPVIVNYSKELLPKDLTQSEEEDPFEILGPDFYKLEPPRNTRAYGYSPEGKAVFIGKTEGHEEFPVYREVYKDDESIVFPAISFDVWFDGKLLFVTHDKSVAYGIADQIVRSGFSC